MLHFSPETREAENGWVEFQVKATDDPSFVDGGRSVACVVEMAHVHYWYWETAHPFILVLYDARKNHAFWMDVQSYIDEHGIEDRRTRTVRIPIKNRLTVNAVDRFREKSLARTQSLR